MLLVVCGVLCCASVLRTSAQSADAFQTVLSTFADDGLGVNRLQVGYVSAILIRERVQSRSPSPNMTD